MEDEAATLLFFSRYDALPSSDSSALVTGEIIVEEFGRPGNKLGLKTRSSFCSRIG